MEFVLLHIDGPSMKYDLKKLWIGNIISRSENIGRGGMVHNIVVMSVAPIVLSKWRPFGRSLA